MRSNTPRSSLSKSIRRPVSGNRLTPEQLELCDERLGHLRAQSPPGTRLSCREISRATGFNESTVSTVTDRAIAKVRLALKELGQEFSQEQIAEGFRRLLAES